MRWPAQRLALLAAAVAACGGGDGADPTAVILGETTFVVVVNPPINDATVPAVPAPGTARGGVGVGWDPGGPGRTTDDDGVAVLAPVAAGQGTLSFDGPGIDAALDQRISEGDLVEVAVAADGSRAQEMARVVYPAGGTLVEVTPDMPIGAVNDALGGSDRIVLLRGGVYRGDLVLSGSRLVLFGESVGGGAVVIEGNVRIEGSDTRIRGALIRGDLVLSGSGAGVSFSRVEGSTRIEGSDAIVLQTELCGEVSTGGSGLVALAVTGLEPLPRAGCP